MAIQLIIIVGFLKGGSLPFFKHLRTLILLNRWACSSINLNHCYNYWVVNIAKKYIG